MKKRPRSLTIRPKATESCTNSRFLLYSKAEKVAYIEEKNIKKETD